MTLKELKKMIAEEYSAYKRSSRRKRRLKEQDFPMPGGPDMGPGMPPPGGPGEPTVAVSDDDIDVDVSDENPEDTLRQIYDMLKDYFEGPKGGDEIGKKTSPKPPAAKKDDDKEDDKGGDKGGAKKDDDKGGANTDDKKDDDKEDDKEDEKDALQERFQKLANIIKG